jgi:hypothetical protein
MQVTIDIPEPRYEEFRARAEQQHRRLEDVVLSEALRGESEEQFQQRMRGRYPLIKSDIPNSMVLPESGLNDALFDDESA